MGLEVKKEPESTGASNKKVLVLRWVLKYRHFARRLLKICNLNFELFL